MNSLPGESMTLAKRRMGFKKFVATNFKRERGGMRFIVTKLTVSAYIHQIVLRT